MLRSERRRAAPRRQRSQTGAQSKLREHSPLRLYIRAAAPRGFGRGAVEGSRALRAATLGANSGTGRAAPMLRSVGPRLVRLLLGILQARLKHLDVRRRIRERPAPRRSPAMPVSVRSFVCLFVCLFVCVFVCLFACLVRSSQWSVGTRRRKPNAVRSVAAAQISARAHMRV